PGLRILAATVNSDLALDRCSVVVIYVNFARAASEALTGSRLPWALHRGRCKRRLYTGSLKREPCVLEFLRWPNFYDHVESVANEAHSGSKSGSSSAISLISGQFQQRVSGASLPSAGS